MRRLKRWSRGVLQVRMTGYSPERFLNMCNTHEMELWGITYKNGSCYFFMTVPSFFKCRSLIKKAGVRLRIVKKLGLPFLLYRSRSRKLYFAGLSCFFLILYVMSLFIWDIEIQGNSMYSGDTIMTYLDDLSIRTGILKSKIDLSELEASFRTQYSEITWVSARISGTRLLIQVKENEVLSRIPQKDETPCNLVAKRDGVITSMVVRQGKAAVSVGDRVEKGQILVKGEVVITDDSETEVAVHYVRADADILAETEIRYEKEIDKKQVSFSETGRTRHGFLIRVFGKDLVFLLPKPKDTYWKFVSQACQLRLFGNFYLPVHLEMKTGREYVPYEKILSKTETEKLAEGAHQEFMKKLMEKGVQIIENNVKILDDGLQWRLQGTFQAIEPIAAVSNITESEETEYIHERD